MGSYCILLATWKIFCPMVLLSGFYTLWLSYRRFENCKFFSPCLRIPLEPGPIVDLSIYITLLNDIWNLITFYCAHIAQFHVLYICVIRTGTILFAGIHLRLWRKCLRRTLLKRSPLLLCSSFSSIDFNLRLALSVAVAKYLLKATIALFLFGFQIWRLQAALGEQAEITKYSQQEFERLQNVRTLPRTPLV